MSSPLFPEPPKGIAPTELDVLDQHIDKLNQHKAKWAKLDLTSRVGLLQKLQQGVQEVAADWAGAVAKAAGIDPESTRGGEAWLSGPATTARNIRLLQEALRQNATPKPPKMWTRDDGQRVAKVFPADKFDALLFTGFTGEVWLEKGKPATQGAAYREPNHDGKVALVLGAGNVSSIGPMDVLYKMFVENEVTILKMNPVNDYLGPFVERAFKVLVDEGYFAVVYGGAEVGMHLTGHDNVDTIHITGSDRTHDAIIWGAPDKQEENKKNDTPVLNKNISSELGCVTPLMIVPGKWSDKEIAFQAEHAASMVAHNGSFNCNAAKVLITAKGWPQREQFTDALHAALKRIPSRKAYYPGAQDRYQGFLDQYDDAMPLGERSDEVVPWTVLPNVKAEKGEYALNTEAFCGVLAEVQIDADDAAVFLEKVIPFVNDEVWGTLSCMILIHPSTEKANKAAFEQALADLRYGGIGVNVWAGLVYGLVTTTWGAFPGHTLKDIRSGRGAVHNTFLFDHPEKSIVRAPFKIAPKPAWFANHQNLRTVGEKLTRFEAAPSFLKLPGLVGAALKG
ncbi:MAG: aldehyde dehydrogenase family protein [Deltaproteobacteria bacterium]|nr:aldehyde dehydrogenase family protein [Deltaproteobacteria bacterium]